MHRKAEKVKTFILIHSLYSILLPFWSTFNDTLWAAEILLMFNFCVLADKTAHTPVQQHKSSNT